MSILAAAYEAVSLPVPWHYRAPRDTRTCFDMAGITDHGAWLTQHATGAEVPHHALHDAIVQARAVCAAIERSKHPEWVKMTQEAPPLHSSVLVRSWGVGPTYDVAVWTGERFIFADVSLDPKQVTHWALIRDLRC